MVFVTGGAYQGKTAFVKAHFGIDEKDIIHGGDISGLLEKAVCIAEYHLFVRRLIREGADPLKVTEGLDADVVIMDEIGSGIIPLDREERSYREAVGMAGCMLAAKADKVIRVICGIPQTIKGTL